MLCDGGWDDLFSLLQSDLKDDMKDIDFGDEFKDYITVEFTKAQTLKVLEYLEGDPEPDTYTDEVYAGQECEIKVLREDATTCDFEFLEGGTVLNFLKTDYVVIDFS